MKKTFISTLFSFIVILAFSQQEIPFTKNKQFYLKGGSTIIGNNIVSKYSKKPFNNVSKTNDEVKMIYVDIDEDESTFSSSQANLSLPQNTKQVVYAGLYWSAIYSFDKGTRKIKGDHYVYQGNDQREGNFHTIKLKTPNKDYLTIKGDILFDGYKMEKYRKNAPYVCFADITHLFKDNIQFDGTYTVANIKATQGFLPGGTAAGWFIYLVYENPDKKLKSISTYNGFNHLNKEPETISLNGFRTVEEGEVIANVSIAALEGDVLLKLDECSVRNVNNGKTISLYTSIRPKRNFFNSTITVNSNVAKRNPESKNTLGFDLLQMDIPNENNTVINNNTDQVDLQLKTKQDRFFLYFTAFETEIELSYVDENKDIEIIESKTIVENLKESNAESIKESKDNNDTTQLKSKDDKVKNQEQIQIRSLKNINIDKRYYLVTNVFSKTALAKNWKQFLIDKGYSPKSFINPENNWEYVYVHSSKDLNKVKKEFELINSKPYFEGLWICKIE